jgi:Na+/H+ antiporter NhaD/arsenite permease-like protein
MTVLSLRTTHPQLRQENGFTFGPITEVAVLFAGIFATMIPALEILRVRGAELGIAAPWQFFWLSGSLSSFLDNAPTYLTFVSLAQSLGPGADTAVHLVGGPVSATLLTAISAGSVVMGANSYIGNGPNFMVKAIAEEQGVAMPSFGGYMLWSGSILIPIFVIMTFIFFV